MEEWIVTKLWGQTQRGERVKQNDCSQLFAIMQKYISQGRPYGLFRMGDATRVSVQELLGQKNEQRIRYRLHQSGPEQENESALQKTYCTAK